MDELIADLESCISQMNDAAVRTAYFQEHDEYRYVAATMRRAVISLRQSESAEGTIAVLVKRVEQLEAVLKKIILADRDFIEAVPHMLDEQDPITMACEEAAEILWPHASISSAVDPINLATAASMQFGAIRKGE